MTATNRLLQLTKDSHRASLEAVVISREQDCLSLWLLNHQKEGEDTS